MTKYLRELSLEAWVRIVGPRDIEMVTTRDGLWGIRWEEGEDHL